MLFNQILTKKMIRREIAIIITNAIFKNKDIASMLKAYKFNKNFHNQKATFDDINKLKS